MTTHFSLRKHVHLQQHVKHEASQLHPSQSFLSDIWKILLSYFFLQYFEQRRWRPSLQPYRTEARRRSRRQKSWRKAWRPSRPMTPPPPPLLHRPNHKAAPLMVLPPSPLPRRKRSSSHRRSWKRARSRRRKQRPEAFTHARPRWNTTVKCFLACGIGVADGVNHIRSAHTVKMSVTDTVY